MSLPKPEPGLVIRYSYLWQREHRAGRDEGSKDRPCAIVLTLQDTAEGKQVLVVPVTHSPPDDPAAALELPPIIKQHLDLDMDRSWVVISESNLFTWPGPDLRRIADRDESSVAYGILPPKFFTELRRRFVEAEASTRSKRVRRTE